MATHIMTAKNFDALADQDFPQVRYAADPVRRLIVRIEALVTRWQRYRTTVNELSRLRDSGLADIGVARHDIRALARSAAFPSAV